MDIYTDYANWKFENYEFIDTLVKNKSKTISRFTPVIAVVDFLYDKYVETKTLGEDEEVFFSSGFDYIHDSFHLIKTILDYKFNKDIDEMEKHSTTINLLLYINEFQAEVLEHKNIIKNEISPLDDLEEKVNSALDQKEKIPDEYFALLNHITDTLFEQNGIEIHTMDEIYNEIAIEYDIYEDDDYDTYNNVLNNQINKNKNKTLDQ